MAHDMPSVSVIWWSSESEEWALLARAPEYCEDRYRRHSARLVGIGQLEGSDVKSRKRAVLNDYSSNSTARKMELTAR